MNRFLLPLLTSLFLILNSFTSLAQSWVPLGPDDFNQLSYGDGRVPNHCLDKNGVVYAVYQSADGILVKKLNGSTWEVVGTGVIDDKYTTTISLAIEKTTNTPYIAYHKTSSPWQALVKKFNGTTWENVGPAGFTTSEAQQISLVFNGSTPYVAYKDLANSTTSASVMKFNGTTWEHVGVPQFSPGRVNNVTMAFDGNTPFVAFEDIEDRYDSDDITIMKFNGTGWEKVGTSITALNAEEPSIAIDNNGVPYVSFMHSKDIRKRAKLYRFTNGVWDLVGMPGFGTDQRVWAGKIAFDDNVLHAVFLDANIKVAVNKLIGNVWHSVGGGQLSGEEYSPLDQEKIVNIDFHNNLPFVSYKDVFRNAVVKRFNGTNWEPAGSQELTPGPAPIKMGVNAGVPYIVYTDRGNNSSVVVRKFNGNHWEAISGLIGNNVIAFDIAFNSDGNPAIIYGEDEGITKTSSGKIYNGTNWLDLGVFSPSGQIRNATITFNTESPNVPYITAQDIYGGASIKKYVGGGVWSELVKFGDPLVAMGYASFALHNNIPYVAYGDPSHERKITVSKFNGTAWEVVGSPGFSTHLVRSQNLVFNSQGVPYVAYANDSYGINIVKFDGTDWVEVAAPISTNGYTIEGLSMIIHNDIPYIAYPDNLNGKKATVKRLNGSTWEDVGSDPSQGAAVPSLAADGATLYISYTNSSGSFIKRFELGTLPVTLTSFTAKAQNQTAQLQWQTASENNNKEFIVMHTADGKSFKEVARVPSKGNGNTLTNYLYEHQNPANGTNYYQLLQVDLDGKTTDHGTKTVNFDLGNQTFVVYPNPTTNEVNISVGNSSLQKIQLVDLNGRTLKTILVKPNQSVVTISLVNYPSGIYLIKTIAADGTATHKIIKQ